MAVSTSNKTLDPKTAKVLHAIYHLSKEQRKVLLKTADRRLVKGVCECALNTIKGNVPLTTTQKKKLAKHKNTLRKLSCKNLKSWQNKKRIIIQKGDGFITALLAPLIGTILSTFLPTRS